jgi:class 3 adenylate cyclase/tetratricopeptide (TPR) repeat protein
MKACPACGEENPDKARLCMMCGEPLSGLGRRNEERKVVTVLFADLVGFTSRAEAMDVEDVRGTLEPYHQLVRRELERYGGTVEKFIGDAVMAVFGAPVAHEDDPERAVRAALAIHEAIGQLRESDELLDLHVRIGVATGEALVVVEARPDAGEGMASGDVVNTAARLQAAAPVDGVLVGEVTYHATTGAIQYEATPRVQAKGKAEPVPAWIARGTRSRLGSDVRLTPATPLVGRERQLELLWSALARAREERSLQLVTVVGVPGIGKSRLVFELLRRVDDDPEIIFWRQGRSLPYGEGLPVWALSEIVKAQVGILHSDSADASREKLHLAVSELVGEERDAAWVEGHLRPLVGLDPAGDLSTDRRAEAFAAWRRFLEAMADRAPTVLVLEDLHWADDGLLDFVDHLVEWASNVPMLCLCTTRPDLFERRSGWGGGHLNSLNVSLSPLSQADTARLVGALLAQAVLPAETQHALLSRAEGNPLYAEEYVRMLRDRGVLVREGSAWRLTAELEALPESVQGIIAARLDALSPGEKAVLQAAAVIGKVSWLGAISAISAVPASEADGLLHKLERKEFVRRQRSSSVEGETEFAFGHLLVRDVAYGRLPRRARAAAHQAAAEWIASLGHGRDDAPAMVAHHYQRALHYAREARQPTGELEAVTRIALRTAAERAEALNVPLQAHALYRDALAMWPEADAEWPNLVLQMTRSSLGNVPDYAVEPLSRARDRFVAGSDYATAAQAETLVGFGLWNQGRGEAAAERFRLAGDLLSRAQPSPGVAYVLSRLAIHSFLAGRNREALALCNEAIELADRFGMDELRAHALNTRGSSRAIAGDVGGIADLEQSIEIARGLNAVETLLRGYRNLPSLLDGLGDVDRADALQREGLEIAARFGAEYHMRWHETELGLYAYYRGDWDAALAAFARLDAWVQHGRSHFMQHAARSCRAALLASRGDHQGAKADIEAALAFARSSGEPQVVTPTFADAALVIALRPGSRVALDLRALARELRQRIGDAPSEVGAWWPAVAAALALHGHEHELTGIAVSDLSRWTAPGDLIVAGRFLDAAEQLAAIGARTLEAQARFLASRTVDAGSAAEAAEEHSRAVSFWRSVDARAFLSLADAVAAPRRSSRATT